MTIEIANTAIETPPRGWGRQLTKIGRDIIIGNTPTRVGKTIKIFLSLLLRQKHPHAGGEDNIGIFLTI